MFENDSYLISWHGKFVGLLTLELFKKPAIPTESLSVARIFAVPSMNIVLRISNPSRKTEI